jgi:hypothetical protein
LALDAALVPAAMPPNNNNLILILFSLVTCYTAIQGQNNIPFMIIKVATTINSITNTEAEVYHIVD